MAGEVMSSWIKVVSADHLQEGRKYFLGKQNPNPQWSNCWRWCSSDINGKDCMSTKPGIATRYSNVEALRKFLKEGTVLQAVEVPDDADKRWKRRQKRY